CYHFVAGHEQRKSFSVESICIDGGYPHGGGGEFREYTYPGVHADIGGGYPPGEQFKSNFGMGHVVAQIALHDMYARCWQHGMPMLIWADHPQLVAQMKKTPRFKLKNYEIMDIFTRKEFDTQPEMVTRFNAWRDVSITDNLNQNLRQQVHHITAWRILRWVKDGVNGYADFLGLQMAPGKGTAGEKEDPAQVSAREQIIRQGRNRANEKAKAGAGGGLPPAPAPDSKKEDELWQQA
ncbi:phospholipase effector Tle1 domain-containing protein, partial [Snodgrassella communis]